MDSYYLYFFVFICQWSVLTMFEGHYTQKKKVLSSDTAFLYDVFLAIAKCTSELFVMRAFLFRGVDALECKVYLRMGLAFL